ncbi:MAG: hypothetical protein ABIP94_25120 [Planctomycetota bacterium]
MIQSLRERLRGRRADDAAIYWALLAKARNADLNEKQLGELDRSASALNKRSEIVEQDLALLLEADLLGDAPDAVDKAKVAHKQALQGRSKMTDRAAQLEAEAEKIRADADIAVERAQNLVTHETGRAQELAQLRAKLAASGHHECVAMAKQTAHEQHIESVENELRLADQDLAEVVDAEAQASERLERANQTLLTPGVLAQARTVIDHASKLRSKRDAVARRLDELRNGTADNDAQDADTEEAEVLQ